MNEIYVYACISINPKTVNSKQRECVFFMINANNEQQNMEQKERFIITFYKVNVSAKHSRNDVPFTIE